jgi:hypothetical protein
MRGIAPLGSGPVSRETSRRGRIAAWFHVKQRAVAAVFVWTLAGGFFRITGFH